MKKHRLYSVIMAMIMAVSFLALLPSLTPPLNASAADYEYALFPLTFIDVKQVCFENVSHQGSYHIDCNTATGSDGWVHAPFTGKVVNFTTSYSACLFQSIDKVYFADGTCDYMTICLEHGDNVTQLQNYYKTGEIIPQWEKFYHGGSVGATGVHFDFGACRGRVNTFGGQTDWSRSHGLTYSGTGNIYPFRAFYIDRNRTGGPGNDRGYGKNINGTLVGVPSGEDYIDNYGYPEGQYACLWKDLPTGPPTSNLRISYPNGKGAPSGNLKQGANFGVYGNITNGIEITKVWGGVYKDSFLDIPLPGYVYTADLAGKGRTSYSLYPDFDNAIIFNNLPAGDYCWKICASDAENTKILAESKFSIVGDAPPSQDSSITIANATKPTGTLKQGSNFGVYGNITSNLNITKVWGGVYNKSDGSKTAQYAEASPNAKTYSLYPTFDNKIIFNNLPVGSYIYKIEATDGVKSYELVKSEFSVGSSDSNSSMSISGETKPTGSLKQGSFFGVYGNITSNLNITKVWGGVYQSDGSTKTAQYAEATPNAKTYSLYPTFDNKIIFNNLAVGSYVYKIQATDGSKTYTLINSPFSIVNPNAGSSMSIKNETKPTGTLKQGSFFGVYGDITSALNITKVWGGVYNRGGSATAQYYEATPNTKTYSLYPTFDNKIIFNNLPVGYYTYKIEAKDSSGKTYTLIYSDFQVGNPQGEMTFTASTTSLSINRSKGEKKVITFTVKNNPETIHLSVVHGSTTLTSTSSGSWSGDDMPITFSGIANGTETLEVQVRNSSEKALATIKIKVTVTSDPFEFNASATSISLNGTETKQVTFSHKNYDGSVSIQKEHGSDVATTLEWGEWSNHTIPLNITGSASGTETLIVYLKDSDTGKVIAMKTIVVTVTGIPTKLTASATALSINMDKSETKSTTFSYSGTPASTHGVDIRCIHGDNVATTFSLGAWENHTKELTFTGYRTGTEKVTVELFDSDTGKTLATQVITVTVTGTPKITASSSSVSLNYNSPTSKDVRFTMTGIPNNCSLQAVHGNSIVCNYEWLGWNGNANSIRFTPTAPGTEVYTIKLLSADKNVIATAQVTVTVAAQFTVKFDANGGTVSTTSKSVSYDAKYGDLPTPTYTGHVFGGWYTSKTGGYLVDKDTSVAITADQTLYAHWTLNSYAVTLDANGGNISQKSISVTHGGQYGFLPTPKRTGYVFDGWYTSATGGTKITGQTTITKNQNHTIYAQWIFKPIDDSFKSLVLKPGAQVTILPDASDISFSSSNTSVAVISKDGIITALKDGVSKISIISPDFETYQVTVTVSSKGLKGDCNSDGIVNIADVVMLQKWLLAYPDSDLKDWQAADIDDNKKLTTVDLTLLKRTLLSE